MDVDEQNEQLETEANSVDTEAACGQQIASSSSRAVNETSNSIQNEETEASTSKAGRNHPQQGSSELNGGSILVQDVEERTQQQQDEQDSLPVLAINNSSMSVNRTDEEENQNEQHIENAGIDPHYPLVLVSRVEIPSADSPGAEATAENNNENVETMEEEIVGASGNEIEDEIIMEGRTPAEVLEMISSLARGGSDNDAEDEDDGDEDIQVWSEEEENEAAFLENPNFRSFANQFEAIRSMIAHTRRSMAEAEANFGPTSRNSLMQRFRRILFILNNRRRRLLRLGLAAPDIDLPEGDPNPAIVAGIGDTFEDDEDEIVERPPTEVNINMALEQEEEINEEPVRFDTNLPTEHSYMGTNMNRVSGVNYLEANQNVKLRLFLHHYILLPGELLPFMIDSSTTVFEGDIDAQNGILFGVCFPCLSKNNSDSYEESDSENGDELLYGVTCQIYELGQDARGRTLIKSRALQRFSTKASDLTVPLEYINSNPRKKCYGYVKILPDVCLRDPLERINMGSLNRFRDNASMQTWYKRMQASTSPWPAHVYKAHSISNIIEKARTQLAQHEIDTMPIDPTQMSYWLVRNLHLCEEMIKEAFLADTVNTRLKYIASTFKKEAAFCCRNCYTHIADCRELFAMSKHGVQSQYCNSAGYIHETNTFYQVNKQNILYSGSPSDQYSWFPGYQWHIIVCKTCKRHIGWEFQALKPNLIPKQFFGISSSSVRVRLSDDRNETPGENAIYVNFLRLINTGLTEFREATNNMPNI